MIISALDADFRREAFVNITELVANAEQVTKLTAVCKQCFAEASFSNRTSQETDLFVIGKEDKYEPLCRRCYLKKNKYT